MQISIKPDSVIFEGGGQNSQMNCENGKNGGSLDWRIWQYSIIIWLILAKTIMTKVVKLLASQETCISHQ